ncbi:MAG: hypothetical protein K0B02_04875 [DPANN group archaeon]|nr:hypothetical protein [DPANN group archaeon]
MPRRQTSKGQFSISTDAIMGIMFMVVIVFFIMHMKSTNYVFTKSVDDSDNKSIGQIALYQMLSCKDLISLDDGGNRDKFIFNYSKIDTSGKFKVNIEKCIGPGLDWAIDLYLLYPTFDTNLYVMKTCTGSNPVCELSTSSGIHIMSEFTEKEKITKLVNVRVDDDFYIAKMDFGFRN